MCIENYILLEEELQNRSIKIDPDHQVSTRRGRTGGRNRANSSRISLNASI